MAELDGETIGSGVVRGLISRRLIRIESRTAGTKTWIAADESE